MGNHSSVSTAQVVIEGIMDEGILALWKDHTATDDNPRAVLYQEYIRDKSVQLRTSRV